jgi:hypothetical protein
MGRHEPGPARGGRTTILSPGLPASKGVPGSIPPCMARIVRLRIFMVMGTSPIEAVFAISETQ